MLLAADRWRIAGAAACVFPPASASASTAAAARERGGERRGDEEIVEVARALRAMGSPGRGRPAFTGREDHPSARSVHRTAAAPRAHFHTSAAGVASGRARGYGVGVARTYREWRRFRCPRPLPGPRGAALRVMR
jgi:hypothetical protein